MSLDSCLIGDWSDGFGEVSGCGNCVCLSGLDCLSLQVNVDTLILCLPPLSRIVLHTVDELLATFGVLDVLNADVDTLLQVAVADTLVDDDTEGGLGDVVDNTGLSVVDFVWHTLLDGSVCLDIDNITDAVLCQVNRHGNHALLAEVTREGISGSRSNTAGVTHC